MNPAQERPAGWYLRPVGDQLATQPVFVDGEGVTLGRDPTNTITVAGELFPTVSAHHARVKLEDGELTVTDLGSQNGTLLQGRPVTSAAIKNGEVIELGEGGPKFAALYQAGLAQTQMVPATRPSADEVVKPSLGQTTIMTLKSALGITDSGQVDAILRRRNRRVFGALLVVVAVSAGGGYWLFTQLRASEERVRAGEERAGRLEQENVALNERLNAALQDAALKLEGQIETWEGERGAWNAQREELLGERDRLETQLLALREEGNASNSEIEALQVKLAATTDQLGLFDPSSIEQVRIDTVRSVREAVVMVETRLTFQEQVSGLELYMGEDELGLPHANLEGDGELVERNSTGSGFCFTEDGLILTNAHVVIPPDMKDPVPLDDEHTLIPTAELQVVFSGDSLRHDAELIAIANDGDEDWALIQIEPFSDMPRIFNLSLDVATPEPGAEVFLYGFPLGNYAVQEGDTVIASTLRGILSRVVGPFLQVDAGVHPGISGGPVTDSRGRIIGIVSSVQATPQGQVAAVIGYVLPIAGMRTVWDPDNP